MNLQEQILKRKKLSDGTMKNYIANINKLHKAITNESEIKNLDFLKKKKEVDEYLSKLNPTSKTNYYGVILTLLDPESELHESYRKDKQENNFQNKKKSETEVNVKIQDKVIDMKDYDEMLTKIKKAGLIQDYVMFMLLKHYPMRNEIGGIEVLTLKEFNKLKEKTGNYLVIGSKQMFFYRTKFKTAKIYGDIKTIIEDKKVKKLLKDYIKEFDVGRRELFLNKKGGAMTNLETANRLSYVSEKYSGKLLSTSSIFKIVLANFKGSGMKEYTDFINKMGDIRGTNTKDIIKYYVYNKSVKEINDEFRESKTD